MGKWRSTVRQIAGRDLCATATFLSAEANRRDQKNPRKRVLERDAVRPGKCVIGLLLVKIDVGVDSGSAPGSERRHFSVRRAAPIGHAVPGNGAGHHVRQSSAGMALALNDLIRATACRGCCLKAGVRRVATFCPVDHRSRWRCEATAGC
jgi:hypothetical protein